MSDAWTVSLCCTSGWALLAVCTKGNEQKEGATCSGRSYIVPLRFMSSITILQAEIVQMLYDRDLSEGRFGL